MGEAQRLCVWCGHDIKPGGRFCTGCGRAIGAKSEGPVPAGDRVMPARVTPAEAAQPLVAEAAQAQAAEPAGPPPAPATLTTPPAGPSPWLAGNAPAQRGPQAEPGGHKRAPQAGLGRSKRDHRWLVPAVVAIAVLLVGGGAGASVYFLHHSPHKKGTAANTDKKVKPIAASHSVSPSASASASSSPSVSGSPSTPTPSREQAAQSLAALLGKSVADRNSVVNAAADVADCGPSLSSDAQVFQHAASSRQALLTKLASLPGQANLPAPMMQALTSAWQASMQADQDLAQWAQDEASQGCIKNDHSDPGYQAATGPDNRATAAKKDFARRWNPLAAQYGLTPYNWNQL
jgi:hypothetical protein